MADISTVEQLQNSGSALSKAAEPAAKSEALTGENINQKEFLTLLVHQLQNQDPLNPMDGQEFAVQLAQFSQVEELMGINTGVSKLVDSSAQNSTAMLASFLGKEVAFGGNTVDVANGQGPNLLLDIPEGTQSIRVDLIDDKGVSKYSANIEQFETGKFLQPIVDKDIPDGNFTVRAVGVTPTGRFVELDPKITGTVEGFVMEPDSGLLINGRQYSLEEITEVYNGQG